MEQLLQNQQNSPNILLQHIYCINLEERRDRWASVQEEWRKLSDTHIVRWGGVDTRGENWHLWCLLSHRQIIEEAQKNNHPSVTVVEDDIQYHGGADTLNVLSQDIQKTEWSIFYFWGSFCHRDFPCIQRYSDKLYRAIGVRGTFGICYNANIYDILLKTLPKNMEEARVFLKKYTAFDYYLAIFFQKDYLCFIGEDPVLLSKKSYSDITKKIRDTRTMNIDSFYFWKLMSKITGIEFIGKIIRWIKRIYIWYLK